MLRKALLYLSERERARDLLLSLPTSRRLAGRFVAGEQLADALAAARRLNGQGFGVTLDYLGESVADEAEAKRAAEIYERSLGTLAADEASATISLKLTQLGLEIDEDLCAENLERVVCRADELNNFVRIDMESSEHTEATFRVFETVFARRSNLGIVVQSYLRRSEADVERLIRLGAPVRLCKGAYDEPASIAFQRRSEVDANYILLMRRLLDAHVRPAIATHDERMIEATRRHASRRRMEPDEFEFQMLYGVRRGYQARLAREGYHMRIYVPYGGQWYPYLMRRMAERPANLWFVARAVMGE
ncbi:MAG: proline dehydrogenase family protein [Gemmatimonadota bacterium]